MILPSRAAEGVELRRCHGNSCGPCSPSWFHGCGTAQTKSSQKLPLTVTGIFYLTKASSEALLCGWFRMNIHSVIQMQVEISAILKLSLPQQFHYMILSDEVLRVTAAFQQSVPQEHLCRGDVFKPESQVRVTDIVRCLSPGLITVLWTNLNFPVQRIKTWNPEQFMCYFLFLFNLLWWHWLVNIM